MEHDMNPKYLSDKDLTTALWNAIGDRLEQRAIIFLTSDLLSTGLDLTFRDELDKSFLMYALEMGCHKVAHVLLETARREDALTWLKVDNQGKNIYHYAAKYNDIVLLDKLNALVQSAALHEKPSWLSGDHLGNTPVHVASQCMQIDIIKWFIAHTHDSILITQMVCQANHQRITPLHLAMAAHTELDKPETVAFLMQHGAHVFLRDCMAILLNWQDQAQFSLWTYLRKIKQDEFGEESAAYYLLKQVKSYLDKKGFNEIKSDRRESFLIQTSSLPRELLDKTNRPLRLFATSSTVRDYYYSNEAMMTNEIMAYEQAVKYDEDDLAQLIQDLNHFYNSFSRSLSKKNIQDALMLSSLSLIMGSALMLGIAPKFLFSIFNETESKKLLSDMAGLCILGALILVVAMLEIVPDPQKMRFIRHDEWQALIDGKTKPILETLQKLALLDPAHLPASAEELDKFKSHVTFFDQRKLSIGQVKHGVMELAEDLTQLERVVRERRLSYTFYGKQLSAHSESATAVNKVEHNPGVIL
jgi:ankyrin repeat protein